MLKLRSARRSSVTVCVSLLLLMPLASHRLHAQELRGLVLMPDGVTPAPGVVAVLMHATRKDSIVARSVTNERGRFALKGPANVRAMLRLLRIGFEPMDGGTYTLAPGEVISASFLLHDTRIKLATLDVKTASRCEIQPDGAQLVAQLFEQARTALIASTTPLSGTISARAVNYDRQQDRRRNLITPVDRSHRTMETLTPYASIGIDSLEKVGYVVADRSDFLYYAPDAEVLVSDKFLARHCLQLASARSDSLAGLVGVRFRPVSNRRNYVDVQGTLWLDRTTSELQFLEFTYTQLPEYARSAGLGGRVEYSKLPNGAWFVNRWSIRMPILAPAPRVAVSLATAATPNRVLVAGLQIAGGEVQDIRVDDQVLYLNTDAVRAGWVSGDPDIQATAEGSGADQRGQAFGMSIDASAASALCGNQLTSDHPGLVTGRVFDRVRQPFAGATVKAEWQERFQVSHGNIQWDTRAMTTTSSLTGQYLLCGIAVNRGVSVSAKSTGAFARASIVRVTEESPVARLDLVLPSLEPKNN